MTLSARKGSSTSEARKTNWQNAQIAPHAQKRSLLDTHQCTYSVLELVSLSGGIFPFHQGKV